MDRQLYGPFANFHDLVRRGKKPMTSAMRGYVCVLP